MKVKALIKGVLKIGWFTKVIGKVSTTENIDRLVSTELPFPKNAPLFETITKCLLHEPCGEEYANTPCMVNGVCKKRYPRAFSEETTEGEDNYPVYCQ
jgi:hypothetical protein